MATLPLTTHMDAVSVEQVQVLTFCTDNGPPDPFQNLPDDVLFHILHFLHEQAICHSVRPVCRRFLQISMDPSVWKHIHLSAPWNRNANSALEQICRYAAGNVSTCTVTSPHLVASALRALHDSRGCLVTLNLSGCNSVGPDAWPLLAPLSALEHLDISHTRMLAFLRGASFQIQIQNVFPPLPSLRRLDADGATLNEALIAHLGTAYGDHLRTLNVRRAYSTPEDCPQSLTAALFPLLSSLHVERTRGPCWFDPSPLASLTTLTHLLLEDILDETVALSNDLSFLHHLPHLALLRLGPVQLPEASVLLSLPSLTSLSLSLSSSPRNLGHVLHRLPRLKHLQLSDHDTCSTPTSFFSSLPPLPAVETATFRWAVPNDPDGHHVSAVATAMARLSRLRNLFLELPAVSVVDISGLEGLPEALEKVTVAVPCRSLVRGRLNARVVVVTDKGGSKNHLGS